MKMLPYLLSLTLFAVVTAHAGPETLVKQRAKDVRDQNNSRQGVPAAPPASQPSGPTPVELSRPTSSKPNATSKLKADLASWQTQKPVKPEAKQEFADDLQSAGKGSKRPSTAALKKFSDSLAEVLAGKPLESADLARLVQNLNLAVNSASLSGERTDEIAAEVQAVIEKVGVTGSTAAAPVNDLKAVMDELRN